MEDVKLRKRGKEECREPEKRKR
ncbi:hypothetical protein Pcinc_027210, partial [Petrolisthes cinctipes]